MAALNFARTFSMTSLMIIPRNLKLRLKIVCTTSCSTFCRDLSCAIWRDKSLNSPKKKNFFSVPLTMHASDPAKEAAKPSATSDYPERLSDSTIALATAKACCIIHEIV